MKLRIMGFIFLAAAAFFCFIFVPVKSAMVTNLIVGDDVVQRKEDAGYRFVWSLGFHEIDTARVWVHLIVFIAAAAACFYFSASRKTA